MSHHYVHPSFGVLVKLGGMKTLATLSGIAHQSEYRTESAEKTSTSSIVSFTFLMPVPSGRRKKEEVCRSTPNETCTFELTLNTKCHLQTRCL
jgi:hypothetical protein